MGKSPILWWDCLDRLGGYPIPALGNMYRCFLGYRGGLILLHRGQELDNNQTRKRIKESLQIEINLHKELLQESDLKISAEGLLYVKILPTFLFDGIIASGLFVNVPPELQKIVSRHYQGCHQNNMYVRGGIFSQQTQVEEIRRCKETIRNEIDGVLEKLNEL